jgi:hypothetical protein
VRNVRKRIVASLVICVVSAVAASLGILAFKATVQLTSVGDIMLNPSAWVNKTVVVEGNLTGPLGSVPENAPPYNYELNSNGTIGVFWSGSDTQYSSANVRIQGVVRQGTRASGPWPVLTCYYIEAETIDVV